MSRKMSKQRISVIDVGTTKIMVIIADYYVSDHVDILGIGVGPSHGLKKGVVVDVGKTINSIKHAIKEAELMADLSVEEVYVGISGAHIASINSSGVVPIKYKEVTEIDIQNVLQAARAVPIERGQKIIHVIPQYFMIDGNMRVMDPRGMHGTRLEVQAHVVTGLISSIENLVTCCESAGVRVKDIVLEHLASSQAVLSNDEKEFGVGVLDIGGGTADLAIYRNNGLLFTSVVPVAGNHFTNDLAIGLHTSIADAENIKHEFGVVHERFMRTVLAHVKQVQHKEDVVADNQMILDILRPRAHELLTLVNEKINENNAQQHLVTGLVITGGGSLLRGIDVLAHEVIDVPVRIGYPRVSDVALSTLHTPIHATGYGMITYIGKQLHAHDYARDGSLRQRIVRRVKSWMVDFF